ncbi:MAG: serine/threonine protein kinase [Myxococcales bacterium]|nr:serine/threonine protein kinase [Myxococcales bacterium]
MKTPTSKTTPTAPFALFALLLSTSLLNGCLHIDTPHGFVELDDNSGYDYRATSATGVVLALRSEESRKDQGGDLGFWAEAVQRKVARLGGYALLEMRDVKTRAGVPGKQLRFGHDRNQRPHHYWVTLFIQGDDLHVVEAGGPKEAFSELEKGLDAAIASLR